MKLYLNEKKNEIFCVIGKNVKFYRNAYNLTHPGESITQAKLAELVGITTTQIANLENETGKGVSVPVLYNIASVLEVSIDLLCSTEKVLVKID